MTVLDLTPKLAARKRQRDAEAVATAAALFWPTNVISASLRFSLFPLVVVHLFVEEARVYYNSTRRR